MNTKEHIVTQSIPGGFAMIASNFVVESLEHMIPWLIVTAAVVLCDLLAGIRRALMMKEQVRLSRAVRRTMGKMVTYFAFVCMIVMVDIASSIDFRIDVWSCLLICFIEFCSILSNILKPKGLEVNIVKALSLFFCKAMKVDKEDVEEVITRDDKIKE